jgi:hypothetical protein
MQVTFLSNIITILEFEHDKWHLTLAICKWLPNAYIERQVVTTFEGGLLREMMFLATSTLIAMSFTTILPYGGNLNQVFHENHFLVPPKSLRANCSLSIVHCY